jgi:TrmH family RNA methyltransferase
MDRRPALGYNGPMELPHGARSVDAVGRKRFSVILSHPENHENIGLVARAMKNTGFSDLRLVGVEKPRPEAFRTAVHSDGILARARLCPDLAAATESLHLVLAATARSRNTFAVLTFPEAMDAVLRYPRSTKVGLLFGNERTGLTSDELCAANFVFTLPQATRQPSYNLASAVLLTLFTLFVRPPSETSDAAEPRPVAIGLQDESVRVILMKLERAGFIHGTNRAHVTEMVRGLFGRLALTEKDRRFLMAVFTQGICGGRHG